MSTYPSLFISTLLLLILSLTCHGQDFIQITSPTNGQTISSKTRLDISYIVLGVQTVTPPPINATYPSSMIAQFEWLAKGTENDPLSITALSGLNTRHYPAGIANKIYTNSWNVPNCHFFSRYNPSSYDFRLVFTPVYAETEGLEGQTIQAQEQQQPIVVPVNIQVNNGTFPKC